MYARSGWKPAHHRRLVCRCGAFRSDQFDRCEHRGQCRRPRPHGVWSQAGGISAIGDHHVFRSATEGTLVYA